MSPTPEKETVYVESPEQAIKIKELQRQIEDQKIKVLEAAARAAEEARRPADEHNRRRVLVNDMEFRPVFRPGAILLGPKGQGKSTFLWLRGVAERPSISLADGTTDFAWCGDCMDTVGIQINFNSLVKVIALLLYTRMEIPESLILFAKRPLIDGKALRATLLPRFYVSTLIAEMTQLNADEMGASAEDNSPQGVFNTAFEDVLLRHDIPFIRPTDALPADATFKDAISAILDHHGGFVMPTFEEIRGIGDISARGDRNDIIVAVRAAVGAQLIHLIEHAADSGFSATDFLNNNN